jgi:amino acid adenylation domain-containing protein
LEVRIDFWNSRINQKTAESVLESFKQALESILSEDAQLGNIDVVPTRQIAQIREWNKDIPLRLESLIQDRVHQHGVLRPNAPAVSAWDGDLTYQELEEEANKLASYMASLGMHAGAKIPFCFEKSKWAVISQLAILKTGGCVVPLGPTQPMQRLEIILKDIDANIILTTDNLADRFKGILPHVVVVDDTLMSQLPNSESPTCSATPDDLAFIMYTSGSTGIPKGVMVTHGSICTSLHYIGAKFKLGPHTRMLQFSAYTFDISIQDIYTTWHYGGCLCIISEEDRLNNLGPAMHSYGVNSANLTSTVAGMVSPNEVPSLETLVLIGEAVKPDAVNRWIDHVTVFNGYGPTECSILASISQLTPGCNALNIGYAIAGALWVVDATNYNRLVPIGISGELLIEGPLQARGYLNDEQKTAAAFVRDPTWASRYGFGTPRRFYRTGDLVQQNEDGSITYMGRRDTQIKFNGQRVETGEIEHHLIQLDAVLDAAVFCPSKGPCKDRLVGLLSLRDFVSEKSPGPDAIPV